MNFACWAEHLQLFISEQRWPSTRAVILGGMFPGWDCTDLLLWTGLPRGTQHQQPVGIASWAPCTDCFLSYKHRWHLLHQPGHSCLHLLSKERLSEGGAAGIPLVPKQGTQGCKSARGAELSWALSALLKRKVFFTCFMPAQCLSWTDNFVLALLPAYKEESCKQPCDKGMMKVQMGTLVSLLCLQISCVRGAVMWCELWETSHIVLFIYSEAPVGQISSILHVSPTWVRTLASLQTEWARMPCKLLSK